MNGLLATSQKTLVQGLKHPFQLIWSHRRLLWTTARNDVRTRVAGSLLGVTWILGYPLLLLGTYSVVYLYVFKMGGLGGSDPRTAHFSALESILYIFCGLVPFLGFSEALTSGVSSVTGNAHLIKNTLFPIELVPVKTVLAAQFTQAVSLLLLVMASLVQGHLSLWALLVVPIWICQALLLTGLVWILSCLNIVVRDLQHLISILVLCLMMISPIAVMVDGLPRPFVVLNPLYHIITCMRDSLIFGQAPAPANMFVLSAMAVLSFLGGFWFIQRMKLLFADNI